MIRISAEQIKTRSGYPYYLILGNDPYLQYYAQSALKSALRESGFEEQLMFVIDNQTDWNLIYDHCQAMNLFSNKILLILDFGEHVLNAATTKNLNVLSEKLTSDVALLIMLNKLTKAQENAAWYKALSDKLVVVNCNAPDSIAMPKWLRNYLLQQNMTLDAQSIELLCHYYEGNLLALTQTIEKLMLLYPDGKIHYSQVEQLIHDSSVFTPYHWVDAMILHKSKRAVHILQQLKINDVEPLILLRVVQRELLLLINLQKKANQTSFRQAFDEHKVWQNRRQIYTDYLMQTDILSLYQILSTLTDMEIKVKTDYQFPIWDRLFAFTLQFMRLTQC